MTREFEITDCEEMTLSVHGYSSEGNGGLLDSSAEILWSSSDESVCTVKRSNETAAIARVSAEGKCGVAQIVARVKEKARPDKVVLTAMFTVRPDQPVAYEFVPSIPKKRSNY
jgi:uncharacterized low-complexity protein